MKIRTTAVKALDYHNLGMALVPIMARTKRPPQRFPLAKYQKQAATADEVSQWFDNGDLNIAAVMGIDGVGARDFDDEDAYRRWAGDYPRLAARLPTSKTSRGCHVFFSCHADDVHDAGNGCDIIVGDDGELKAAGYVLLPESVHPSGATYEWLNPPSDFPFLSDLHRAGLVPKKRRGTHNMRGRPGHDFPPKLQSPQAKLSVSVAIESTQPTGRGERHIQIFRFACLLKLTELREASLSQIKPAFEAWFRLAKPRIRTKRFAESWYDFTEAWPRANPPRTKLAELAERCAGDGIERLESLCRELQAIAGESPFFLDCRSAATVLGTSKSTAHRWLTQLQESGTVQLIRQGEHLKRRASEYRYDASRPQSQSNPRQTTERSHQQTSTENTRTE